MSDNPSRRDPRGSRLVFAPSKAGPSRFEPNELAGSLLPSSNGATAAFQIGVPVRTGSEATTAKIASNQVNTIGARTIAAPRQSLTALQTFIRLPRIFYDSRATHRRATLQVLIRTNNNLAPTISRASRFDHSFVRTWGLQ
jgi:hypothetical protein